MRAESLLRASWPLWALVAVVLVCGCSRPRLDADLCPIAPKPQQTTVLLIDTSDPLAPKHSEKLETVIEELMGPSKSDGASADYKIEPGEEFIVYELPADLEGPGGLEPTLRVCNPGGNPDTRTAVDDLTTGRVIELRRWRDFEARVKRLFEKPSEDPLPRSLILESIGVIAARHAPSRRAAVDGAKRLHLILYSDLVQHSGSGGLSHYGPYSEPEALLDQTGLRHLKSDLSAVDVSIYRLERATMDTARWQTTKHYYWWKDLVHAFGGEVIWLESI